MAVKLHRCAFMFIKGKGHGCWQVESALQDMGIEYERETMIKLPRSRRSEIIRLTNQRYIPVIEFEDGSAYRAESAEMAAAIRAGKLFEGRGGPAAGAGHESHSHEHGDEHHHEH